MKEFRVNVTVSSKFGNSEEVKSFASAKEFESYKKRLKTVHHSDGATITFSNLDECYFEQIV